MYIIGTSVIDLPTIIDIPPEACSTSVPTPFSKNKQCFRPNNVTRRAADQTRKKNDDDGNSRCGGRDSNPRTPLRVDLEPTAVDHLATSASFLV